MKRRSLLGSLLLLPGPFASAATPKIVPWRLDVRVYSAKSDRLSKKEMLDDRAVRMNFKIEITNQEFKEKLGPAKATLIAFAKHVNQSSELHVLLRDQTTFTLEPLKKHVHETPSVVSEYDDKAYAQFGYKYLGYLLVIQNDKGEFLAIRSTPPMLGDNVEKALQLRANTYVKRDFSPSTKLN
jgi:hypothetical protein